MSRSYAIPVARFLERVQLGPRRSWGSLTLWPLLWPLEAPVEGPEHVSLGDALEDGFVGIEALPGAGGSPLVRIQNRAASAVLVLRGEALPAAGRDRVAAVSLMVPAQQELRLVAARGAGRCGRAVEALLRSVEPTERELGFVAALGGHILGLEAVGRPGIFARGLAALLLPYASAALGGAAPARPGAAPSAARVDAPEALLAGLRTAAPDRSGPAPGLGRALRLSLGALRAEALTVRGALVHLRVRAAPAGVLAAGWPGAGTRPSSRLAADLEARGPGVPGARREAASP